MLIERVLDQLGLQISASRNLVYDEVVLKDKIVEVMQPEFAGVCRKIRQLPEIVDGLFFVLNTTSIPKLDGINDLLKEGLNNLFTDPHPNAMMRYSLFNSLVQKYESYLKKLYYLINDDEVEGRDGKEATLSNAIHAFRCLWDLRYAADEDGKKFSAYLQMLRDWRNEEAHNAPVNTEAEVDAAVKVVVALYLYVTASSITGLETAGHDMEQERNRQSYALPEDGDVMCRAAEEVPETR